MGVWVGIGVGVGVGAGVGVGVCAGVGVGVCGGASVRLALSLEACEREASPAPSIVVTLAPPFDSRGRAEPPRATPIPDRPREGEGQIEPSLGEGGREGGRGRGSGTEKAGRKGL